MKSSGAEAEKWKKKIPEGWFRDIDALVDPLAAYQDWNKWIANLIKYPDKRGPELSIDERVRRYLLSIAAGVSSSTVKNYVTGKHLSEKNCRIGRARLEHLRKIDLDLGFTPREGVQRPREGRIRRPAIRRIALVTELKNVPSLTYHQSVIRSILGSAQHHNASLVIHEVSRSEMDDSVAHFIRVHEYDALVFLRLTPNEDLCALLRDRQLPVVTIHADMRTFSSPPILANIVPRQQGIGNLLRGYVADCLREFKAPKVVLMHMPKEGTTGSIRDERIECLAKALGDPCLGLKLLDEVVEDYSFRRAFEVYEKHRREKLWPAQFYVCLSNDLALAMRCLLTATAPRKEPGYWSRRIIGFDNQLPPEAGIVSFDQRLEQIGPEAMKVLGDFFERQGSIDSQWPPFQQREIPVSLTYE